MNNEEKNQHLEDLDKLSSMVSDSKGSDYATSDVLSNFKRLSSAAAALNINVHSPEGYAMFMVLLKIDRINNLLKSGKKPSNESLKDSFIDGINYLKLAYLNTLEYVYPIPSPDVQGY